MISLTAFNMIKAGAETNTRVFTPQKIVKEMLDALPPEVWNSKTTFLDPAVKSGVYLVEIYNRLMETPELIKDFPDEQDRAIHIYKNQLFGIAIDNFCCLMAQRNLYGHIGGESNIRFIEKYMDLVKNKDQRFYMDAVKKEFNNMKFDVVIGNPPYQKINGNVTEGSVAAGESIYQLFVEYGTKLADIVCMITPAKWFAGNKKLNEMRKIMLQGNHVTYMKILDAHKVFDIIMDRVTIFCWNKKYNGKALITNQIDGRIEERYLASDGMDCFITNNIEASIVYKVLNDKFKGIEKYITGTSTFGIGTYTRPDSTTFSEDALVLHYTGYQFQGDNVGYISKDSIQKGQEYIDKYKVLYPDGCGSKGNVITRVILAGPREVCTASYHIIGPFNEEDSAKKVEKYIKTKFVRALIRVRMTDQHVGSDRFRFVPITPLDDVTIDWSQSISDIDKQLYKKYNLTEEEIAYIEETINPMT